MMTSLVDTSGGEEVYNNSIVDGYLQESQYTHLSASVS